MAESTAHISSAIGWTSSMLTYVGPGVLLSEGWYGKYPECSDAARAAYEDVLGKRPACDEFPYLRTWEGGETNYLAGKVSLKLLDAADNSVGGSMFRAFLTRCKVNKSERFRVVPVSGTSHGTDKNGAPCM